MQKRKCILKNSVSGAICELEFDLDKSLINNIRVWCHTYGQQMRHFIPEKHYNAIMKDRVPEEMKITSQICFGKQFVHISENVVLSSQVGKLAEREDIPEIRLNMDDYVLSKNELDVYRETEESLDDSKKAQLIVVYQEIDGIPYETMHSTLDTGCPANKNEGKNLSNDAKPQSEQKKNVTNLSKNKNTSKKKKKSKVVPILLGLIVLGAAGSYGAFTIANNPVKNLNEMLSAENYEDVVILYNEEINGDEKKEDKVNEVIDSCIDKLMETYTNDNSTCDVVVKDLTTFTDIKKTELAKQAEEYLAQIQFNEDANAVYQEAEEKYNAQEYLNAMVLYRSVPEQAQAYEQAQEKYITCRETLLEDVAGPQTAEDYENYIGIIDGYLAVLKETEMEEPEFVNYKNVLLNEYTILMNNALRTDTVTNAETAFSQANYSGVFEILKQGLEALPGDLVLEQKVEEYQTKYVNLIKSQVDAQVQNKKYSQAAAIINTAISVYDCDEFKVMLTNIEQLKVAAMGTYQAVPVEFLVYEDSIENEDQKNEYEFTAPNTGRYGFAVSNLISGFKITVRVYSAKTGDEVKSYRGMTNNAYFYADLTQNESYKVVVEHYTGTGAYTLKVGQQKSSVDVSNVNVVNDSIEYENQNNGYTFVPEYTGNYRLDFSNIMSNFKLSVYVYDSLGYEVNRYRGISNGNGLTLALNGGEQYRIEVIWYSGVGNYTMSIGRQSYTSALSLGTVAADAIDFTDQTNYYSFTPVETGNYILNFSEMESGFTVNVYVFDSLGYETERYRGLGNEGNLKFDASAGEEYKIRISYYSKLGEYKFTLNRNTEN